MDQIHIVNSRRLLTMNELTVYRLVEGVKAREESFGLLIVSKSTPALSLNEDGKVVWELINGKNSVKDMIDEVSKQYDKVSVREKVIELVEGFEKLNLIEPVV
jgi:Coenzyme PQQ synthesis protein D (PqqD).